MISDALQYQIHSGDREAFKTLFAAYGKGVYIDAISALESESAARDVVKQTFFRLQRELIAASGPMDAEARLTAIMREEIDLAKRASSARQQPATGWEQQRAAEANTVQQGAPEMGWQVPPADEIYYNEEPAQAAEEAEERPAPSHKESKKRKERKAGWVLLVVCVVLLALILVWLVAGILMDLAVIPYAPLGYDWFNDNIYPFFWQSA